MGERLFGAFDLVLNLWAVVDFLGDSEAHHQVAADHAFPMGGSARIRVAHALGTAAHHVIPFA